MSRIDIFNIVLYRASYSQQTNSQVADEWLSGRLDQVSGERNEVFIAAVTSITANENIRRARDRIKKACVHTAIISCVRCDESLDTWAGLFESRLTLTRI